MQRISIFEIHFASTIMCNHIHKLISRIQRSPIFEIVLQVWGRVYFRTAEKSILPNFSSFDCSGLKQNAFLNYPILPFFGVISNHQFLNLGCNGTSLFAIMQFIPHISGARLLQLLRQFSRVNINSNEIWNFDDSLSHPLFPN